MVLELLSMLLLTYAVLSSVRRIIITKVLVCLWVGARITDKL